MKPVVGAILLLANAVYVHVYLTVFPHVGIRPFGHPDPIPTLLWWLIVIHSLAGGYYLFFADFFERRRPDNRD